MVNTGLVNQTTVGRLSLNGWLHDVIVNHTHTHTHTRLTALFPGLPG